MNSTIKSKVKSFLASFKGLLALDAQIYSCLSLMCSNLKNREYHWFKILSRTIMILEIYRNVYDNYLYIHFFYYCELNDILKNIEIL